jgi:hypothetical protein
MFAFIHVSLCFCGGVIEFNELATKFGGAWILVKDRKVED